MMWDRNVHPDDLETLRRRGPTFTGKDGDAYYWKGLRWLGDTNRLGQRPLVWVEGANGAIIGIRNRRKS